MSKWITGLLLAMVFFYFNGHWLGPVASLGAWLGTFTIIFVLLARVRALPGFLMKLVDKYSDKAALKAALSAAGPVEEIDAAKVIATLTSKVVGQDRVATETVQTIRRRLALAGARSKPVGIFLFVGPPGVGKTWFCKVLAETLGRRLLVEDMTQYSESHSASTLFGAPRGYAGSDEAGKLPAFVRDNPAGVLVLDEIEKAHPDITKKFLVAWNDGQLADTSSGQSFSCKNTIWFMTSNVASEQMGELAEKLRADPDALKRAVHAKLREHGFAPEVLSRIDEVFVFDPLSDEAIAEISLLEILRFVRAAGLDLADQGVAVELLVDAVRAHRAAGEAGVRSLNRRLESAVADGLIEARRSGAKLVALASAGDGRISVEVVR